MAARDPILRALDEELAKEMPRRRLPALAVVERQFETIAEDRYRFSIADLGLVIQIDRLRRDFGRLVGELCVRCDLPGARTYNGILSIADFTVSDLRSRQERAKYLAARANTRDLDWLGVIEEFCARVLEAEQTGQPAVDLRTFPLPSADDSIQIEGLHLLRRHPVVLFGDGGAAKSYLALYLAGRLAEQGLAVALFDWELTGEDHHLRLRRLFPDGEPRLMYARCQRPLVHEMDRLRRIVQDHGIDYALFDSVAYACEGAPESAEAANRYFRCVRQVGVGSLQIAHITKGENADQRPFGSAFWHNSARSTWYVQKSNESPNGDLLEIGLFNRKQNLGKLRPPLGYRITFGEHQTAFRRMDVADSPDLAGKLTIRQRMTALLRKGAMTPAEIAEEIEAKPDTIERTARRYPQQFVVIPGGRIGLLEKGSL